MFIYIIRFETVGNDPSVIREWVINIDKTLTIDVYQVFWKIISMSIGGFA